MPEKPLKSQDKEKILKATKGKAQRTVPEPLLGRGPICYGDQWRNNSRKNEGVEPKQKQYPAMDVTGDRGKV